MLKRTLTAAAFGLAAMAMGQSALAAGEVRIYNWSDYIDESILADFTKETGIKVVYDVFDSNDILETKLLAGSTGYDLVVPTGIFLSRQIQAGVFQKLDKDKLPNIKFMWPQIEARTAKLDPGNAYSINYMWGTTGIGINVDKVQAALGPDAKLDSWSMLFDPKNAEKLASCGIFMLDAAEEVIATALNYIGENPDSKETAVIEKAEGVLMPIRPFVQKFHSSEYINALANGDICIALGWSGDMFQAQARAEEAKNGVNIQYVIPKEGALMWFDQMAIPKDAPHVENALKFMNYIMRPEVIAKATNYVLYANGNLASQAYVDKAVLDDPAIYPTPEVVEKLFTQTPYGPREQRVLTRLWTKIKTGQ